MLCRDYILNWVLYRQPSCSLITIWFCNSSLTCRFCRDQKETASTHLQDELSLQFSASSFDCTGWSSESDHWRVILHDMDHWCHIHTLFPHLGSSQSAIVDSRGHVTTHFISSTPEDPLLQSCLNVYNNLKSITFFKSTSRRSRLRIDLNIRCSHVLSVWVVQTLHGEGSFVFMFYICERNQPALCRHHVRCRLTLIQVKLMSGPTSVKRWRLCWQMGASGTRMGWEGPSLAGTRGTAIVTSDWLELNVCGI